MPTNGPQCRASARGQPSGILEAQLIIHGIGGGAAAALRPTAEIPNCWFLGATRGKLQVKLFDLGNIYTMGVIRVGPAGWAYKDWHGIVYPAKKPKGFDPIEYLARYFDTIEINSTFYGPARPGSAKTWAERVSGNAQFRFTAKMLRNFTHERNGTPQDERDFKNGLTPLVEAGRLGAVLLQFPWSFRNTPENRVYLTELHRRFQEFPLVLEVRHVSWAEEQVLSMLENLGIGLCNIDQPLFHRSIKPGAETTSGIGYVRLHGRNYRNWFAKTALSHERYDYLYSVDELEPWVDRIKAIARRTTDTYAVSNNHHLGKAAVNGLEIAALLSGKAVNAPAPLLVRYPELKEFANEDGQESGPVAELAFRSDCLPRTRGR